MARNKEGISRISIYVTESVKSELEARAQLEGITLSSMVRPYLRPISKGELIIKPERFSGQR